MWNEWYTNERQLMRLESQRIECRVYEDRRVCALFWGKIWPLMNASGSNRKDRSREPKPQDIFEAIARI